MKTKTIPFEILLRRGPGLDAPPIEVRSVSGYPVGALVVHRSLRTPSRWYVTHAGSSVAICYAPTHRDALRAARDIDAKLDWQFGEADALELWRRVRTDRTFRERLWQTLRSATEVPIRPCGARD